MTRYRKKPVEVEAWKIERDKPKPRWVGPIRWRDNYEGDPFCDVAKFGIAREGYWLVKDGDRKYVLPPTEFEQTYEVVE